MITFTIDDIEITVHEDTTILDAAQHHNIYIPHLCTHPDLPTIDELEPEEAVYRDGSRIENQKPGLVFEGCRLCVVEIDGMEGLHRACHTPVTEGMVVRTTSSEINTYRQDRLMRLFEKHPHACLTCAQKEGCARFPCSTNIPELERCCAQFGRCEFQNVAEYVGLKPETPRYVFENLPHIQDGPLFDRDYNLCIGCCRCVRICSEIRGVEALGFVFNEDERVVVGSVGPTLHESACRFCTACVEVCPTGALMDKASFEAVPCSTACPVGIDVPRYVRLIAEGKFDESYAVIRERLPLPSVCSYICFSFCEHECRRDEVNAPVGIRALKRFVCENHGDLWKKNIEPAPATGKQVAVVGSGPAGLTVAYYLARKGHGVTIFEQARLPGGMLRQAISRKRLPMKALEGDIEEILNLGVEIKFNTPITQVDPLFEEGFSAVFLATGSTFVGTSDTVWREEPSAISFLGNIKGDPVALSDIRDGVFTGGDAVLSGISEDFICQVNSETEGLFFDKLISQLSLHRGDSSRSAINAIAAGRKAAEEIDRYLGGDGDIHESLLLPDETNHWLGREEGFADLERVPHAYRVPPPQYAGLNMIEETPLNSEGAMKEAGRCLRCDLRFELGKPVLPPKRKLWVEFTPENVAAVPEGEGIFQLLDDQEHVIYIKGAMNLRGEINEQLETNEDAQYFMYELDEMFTKKESELLQQFITEHGEMPQGNRELDDLF